MHAKYQASISHSPKIMTKIKLLPKLESQTDGQKLDAPEFLSGA